MSPGDWNSFHARPSNSPRVRIAAMACLVVRFRAQGLLQGLLQVVAAQDCDEPFSMERALTVVPSHASPGILGRSRARDIVINVLLPFSHAFGNRTNAPDLSARALRLYRKHPREDSNCIERHMTAQLGLSRGMVDSARRQQGLLHIYSSLCRHGSCGVCRLGEPEAGHNVQVQPIPVSGQ